MEKIVAIIVAGGKGERMGGEIPKQFLPLAGKPIIIHTLEKFEAHPEVTDIIIVCHHYYIKTLEDMIKAYQFEKIYKIIDGGKTRQESSFKGVVICPEGTEVVMVHDAVRPFVTEDVITNVIASAKEIGASAPAIESSDTVIMIEDGLIEDIPERGKVRRIQTPQGFTYAKILQAHEEAISEGVSDFTDDCGLVLSTGGDVRIVEGSEDNVKITTQVDLDKAEHFLSKKLILLDHIKRRRKLLYFL